MAGRIPIQSVIDACNSGIQKSYYSYSNMTCGEHSLWHAPEYFITTIVALELNSLSGSKFVLLEYGAHDTLYYSRAVGKGRLHKAIRANGRVDILLCWANGSPRAIIEIKNCVYEIHQYKHDIDRIKEMLKRKESNSSLEFGVFSFYTEPRSTNNGNSEESLNKRLSTIEKNIRKILAEEFSCEFNINRTLNVDKKKSWCAVSVLIKRK